MRIPTSVFAVKRFALALALIAGSVILVRADRQPHQFSIADKAHFASQALVEYVNPGLVFNVVSAKIDPDGTISVDYQVTDPKGLPLDITGIQTPGTIGPRYLIAYIPKGQKQFASYVVNTVKSVDGAKTGTQAAGDSGGVLTTVSVGEYIYKFKNKAPAGFDATATHRVGVYGSRNLTQWDLGTNYASTTFDWVPAGNGAKPAPRDVVRTGDCNKCHDSLQFHGGSRVGVDLCIMCHQPQTVDPNTGNSLDMKVFIHSIHMGASLPSVKAGKPYQIFGFNNSVSDFSTVKYPSTSEFDPRVCETCHNPKNGAAQTNAWVASPNRAACGGCHNDVNFATGQNHVNLPQVDDNQCSQCHIAKGELEFDASIMGAHTVPTMSATAPGINFQILKVVGGAGQKPVVTFTLKDNAGNGILANTLVGGQNRLALVLAGPTSDYG